MQRWRDSEIVEILSCTSCKSNQKLLSKKLGRSERAVGDIWKMAYHIPGTMKFREPLLSRVLTLKKKLKVGSFKFREKVQTLFYIPKHYRKFLKGE